MKASPSHQWPTIPLHAVLKLAVDGHLVQPDQYYPTFEVYGFGRGLFSKPPVSGATISAKNLFRVREGQFIFSRLKAFEGAFALVTKGFDGHFVTNEFPTFDCVPDKIIPEYLASYFKLSRTWQQAARFSTGIGARRERLQPEEFLQLLIPLPPIAEQRRLVELIDAVASRIHEARQLRKQAAEATTALMQATRRRHVGDEPASSWRSLNTWVKQIANGWSPACESRPATNDEWGVLKVGAVSFGRFNPRENKALPPSLEPLPEYEIRPGDFLMSRANTVYLVGACAIVEQTPPRLILCDKIFRFVFHEDAEVLPRYLDHVLKSPALRKQIERGASGTSPTMKNISKDKVLGLLVPQPSIKEQRRVVEILDAIDIRIQQVDRHQSQTDMELDALLPSLLNRVFNGTL